MDDASVRPDFRTLVDEHYAAVYRYACWLARTANDAEDLTQEAFCSAGQNLHRLREPRAALAWLYTILRNCHLRHLRSRLPVPVESLDDLPEDPPAGEEPLGEVEVERLRQLLDELPEPFRTPVVMFYYEELSYREIADALGVPIGTIMSRLARGKAHLRNGLRTEEASPANRGASAGRSHGL